MAEDYARRVADALIEQLRQGTAPWQRPWEPGQQFLPYNPTSGNAYRGMNAMWLLAAGQEQGYADPRWMTYRQAQGADAQVRKGEKGTAIQYWKWKDDEQVRGEDGRPVVGENGQAVTRTVDLARPRVFTAIVFNAAQIDGLAPAPDAKATPEWERHARADAILANSGAAIRHQPGDAAYYAPGPDRITLPERGQFPTAEGYYRVALHELGHWTGHPSRLDRDLAHPFGSEGYAREELRAEIASLMIGGQLEIGHDAGQHAAYVDGWIKALQDDPREVFRAAADAEKIAAMVRGFERVQAMAQTATQSATPSVTQSVSQHAEQGVPPPAGQVPVQEVPRGPAVPNLLDAPLGRDLDRFLDRTAARLTAERSDLVPGSERLAEVVGAEARRGYVADGIEDRVSVLTYRWLDVELESEQEAAFAAQDRQWQAGDRAELDAALRDDLGAYLTRVGDDLATRDAPVARGTAGYQAAVLDSAARYVGALADRVTDHVEQWLAHARAASEVAHEASPDRVRAPRPVAVDETRERPARPAPDTEDAMSPQQGQRTARGGAQPVARPESRTYLAVPYAEKDQAKASGARWDRDAKSWYAPAGVDRAPLARWLPELALVDAVRDPRIEFADALQTAGLRLDGTPVMDGQLRRVPVEGDRASERSGAYVGHLDGHPAGYVENFKTGHKANWRSQQPVAEVNAADRARLAEEAAAHRAARAAARDQQAHTVAVAVQAVWDAAQPATGDHPYLAAKGVRAYGVRVAQTPALQLGPWAPDAASREKVAAGQDVQRWGGPGALLVPVRTADGRLAGAQAIDADGRKSFPRGGRLAGGFHVIGDLAAPGPLLVAEGYATAATLHEHTAAPVAIAFHAGNLEPVARALRAAHPDRAIVVAADNDHRKAREPGPDGQHKKNVGLEQARVAAAAVDGAVLVPAFGPEDRGSDWNDLRQEKGPKEFARQLGRGLAVAERQQLVTAARADVAARHTPSLGIAAADGRAQTAQPERESVRSDQAREDREVVQTARRGPRQRGH